MCEDREEVGGWWGMVPDVAKWRKPPALRIPDSLGRQAWYKD